MDHDLPDILTSRTSPMFVVTFETQPPAPPTWVSLTNKD